MFQGIPKEPKRFTYARNISQLFLLGRLSASLPGVAACRAIVQDIRDVISVNEQLLVVDLITGCGDLAEACVFMALENKEIRYIGFDVREYAIGYTKVRCVAEVVSQLERECFGYQPPPQNPPSEKVEWSTLVAEVNKRLRQLRVRPKDGSLSVPSAKSFKIQTPKVKAELEALAKVAGDLGPRFTASAPDSGGKGAPAAWSVPAQDFKQQPHLLLKHLNDNGDVPQFIQCYLAAPANKLSEFQIWIINEGAEDFVLVKRSNIFPIGQLEVVVKEDSNTNVWQAPLEPWHVLAHGLGQNS